MNSQADIIIIGSGLGGLLCGAILSLEGYKVCILEKNKQIGGCLQTFARDKHVFDSGVHYIGGLAKGQNLYQIFQYLGIMEKLKLQQLDTDAFDTILFGDEATQYPIAQGYENFKKQLLQLFSNEEIAIDAYCEKMQDISSRFPMYNLRMAKDYDEKEGQLEINALQYINSITTNQRLRDVLAGNNFLYAGLPEKTPLYVHALILNSYIGSSWKCVDGGSQISRLLAKIIRNNKGDIHRHSEVVQLHEQEGRIIHVTLSNGKTFSAKHFISNIHPSLTFDMLESPLIRKLYRKKINEMPNSIGSFSVNIVLKPNSFPYTNTNYYYHTNSNSVWHSHEYDNESWPKSYCLFLSPSANNKQYAESASLLTYMRFDDVKEWEHTFNTVSAEQSRGESYEAFKKEKAEKLMQLAFERFPALEQCIQSYYVSTPLSFRDYIGNKDGSMYGISKDYRDPLMCFIPPNTKIPNLFLTGQNQAMHGILGVSISALVACSFFTDIEKLLEKINNA